MRRPKLHTPTTALPLPALWVLVTALLLGLAAPCPGQTQEPTAKADVVLNLLKGTDWPAAAFSSPDSPVVIAVLGEGEMVDALKRAASGQRVRGRAVEVRRLTPTQPQDKPATPDDELNDLARQARSAHALFVCASDRGRVEALLQRLGKADVLTVGDIDEFIERGGMLGLTVRVGQVVTDVNPEKIQGTQLKISPQVLQAKEGGADRASTVKAGMVLNFIRYTEWPAAAFSSPDSPIVIAVLGEGEMVDVLRQTVSGQRVRGRAVEVRRLAGRKPQPGQPAATGDGLDEALRQAREAHVLFVCDSERDRVDAVLQRLGKADVLTVSDMDAFAERGGMLGLAIRRKKIAVDANTEKIQGTQLKVSSQLLRLAQTVKSRGQ